ncbi:MAG: LysM peptidoglycan-binding domain-containing protein [Planctomycetota bacterium]
MPATNDDGRNLTRWTQPMLRGGLLPVLAAVALVGCKAKQDPTVERVPPPPAQFGYLEPVSASATPVDPYAPAPQGDAVFVPVTPLDGRVDAAAPGSNYTVQKGDTLWSIASRVYGNGQKHRDILAANPQVNPNRLLVGQNLVMP